MQRDTCNKDAILGGLHLPAEFGSNTNETLLLTKNIKLRTFIYTTTAFWRPEKANLKKKGFQSASF